MAPDKIEPKSKTDVQEKLHFSGLDQGQLVKILDMSFKEERKIGFSFVFVELEVSFKNIYFYFLIYLKD